MTKHSVVFIALALALASAACSSTGSASSRSARRHRNPNLITEAELAEVAQQNVFDAIRQLRPAWLRVRGRGTVSIDRESTIPVYLDGVLRGSTLLLGRLRPSGVQEIRYLDPSTATIRYGSSHRDGAIMVTMKQLR
ncbi:MAG: hypothetical protein BMS9Abin29_1014 [Gemmatimonadota bacterium]|nr:MAG: hypothetical protein BMS9Abin29_1014 [Gemmatimonadota bacterium]